MEVIDCGDKISEWLSQYLLATKDGFRLGYYEQNLCRRRGAIEIMRNDSPKLLSVYEARDNDSVSHSFHHFYRLFTSHIV